MITTQIDAVNTMLSAIGAAPISTLVGNKTKEAAMAENLLDETSTFVQMMGWHFNAAYNTKYAPDLVTGQITLPATTLYMDGVRRKNPDLDLVQHGQLVYDRKEDTYVFTKDVYLDVVTKLDWDLLPQHVRQYIMVKATRTYVDRMDGDQTNHIFTARDELEARAVAKRMDGGSRDVNIRSNLPAVARRGSPLDRISHL